MQNRSKGPIHLRLSGGNQATQLKTLPGIFFLGWVLLLTQDVFVAFPGPVIPMSAALITGIFFGSTTGFFAGISLGIAADLLASIPLGSHAFAAGLVGLFSGSLSRTLSRTSWIAHGLCIAMLTLPYRVLIELLTRFGGHPHFPDLFSRLLSNLVPIVGLDLLFAIPVFLLCKRLSSRNRG